MTLRMLVLSLLLSAAVGCDDSNANPEPDDTTITTSHGSKTSGDGSSGKGGSSSGAAGKSGDTGKTNSGGAGGSKSASNSNSSSSGDDAGMSVPAQPTNPDDCKTGMSGCFCGAPTKDTDFLNQCTAAMCNPFDNSKLKKRNADGSLPPIP